MTDIPKQGPFFLAQLPSTDGQRLVVSDKTHHITLAPFEMHQTRQPADIVVSKPEYLSGVQRVVEALKSGAARKAVISRIIHLARPAADDTSKLFNLLAQTYPNTLTYCFRDQEGQLWMGATPEILLRKRGETWETMSLAGTVKAGAEETFGEKEREEQAMVTEHILDVLKSNGCYALIVGTPEVVNAGPVSHIRTMIRFGSSLSGSEMAAKLHPTPAVCGLPTAAARELISRTELHDRSYYTGYIGIEHHNGDEDYFVNLRCMRIHEDHYSLYVGGGITSSSDAEKEWQETEMKSDTLSAIINRSRDILA
ncbi:MAG: hypothetical protein RL220_443 [Bacteroidota bacterium]